MKESQLKVMLFMASAWLCLVMGQADLSSWVQLVTPWVYIGWVDLGSLFEECSLLLAISQDSFQNNPTWKCVYPG